MNTQNHSYENGKRFASCEKRGEFARSGNNTKIFKSNSHCTPRLPEDADRLPLSIEHSNINDAHDFEPRTITPLPCPNCIDIVFCSKKCRDEALASYHRYECGILETIWKSGSSINVSMALRIITQRPLEYFKKLRNELTDDLTYEKVKQ